MRETTRLNSSRSRLPQKGKNGRRSVRSFKAPPTSRWRRRFGYVLNGWTVSITTILLLVAFLTLTYYWFQFSDQIDRRLLSGEVYTPTAGIYSAPKILKAGEPSSL